MGSRIWSIVVAPLESSGGGDFSAVGQGPNNTRPINMGHLQMGSLVRGNADPRRHTLQLAVSQDHASGNYTHRLHFVHFRLVLTIIQ
jgi:hypothetical protein